MNAATTDAMVAPENQARDAFLVRFVYGLRDPRDQRIRYVGRTRNLTARVARHIAHPGSLLMRAWLLELRELQLAPEPVVLETVPTPDLASEAEARWIKKLKADLLNYQGVRVKFRWWHDDEVPAFELLLRLGLDAPRLDRYRSNRAQILRDYALSTSTERAKLCSAWSDAVDRIYRCYELCRKQLWENKLVEVHGELAEISVRPKVAATQALKELERLAEEFERVAAPFRKSGREP